MKYILFYLLLLIVNTSIFAQDNIQPKWGISYCEGRVRGYSQRYELAIPLSKDWKYSALNIYYIFHLKKFSIQTGLEMQRTKTFWYLNPAKYPTYIITDVDNAYLGYSQLVYNFLPSKRISPYLGIGCASRIIDYNTVFGEGGVNIQPKSDFPLFIGLKGHLSRAFFSKRMGVFHYLDNVAFGLSVQYAFKANKQTKDK